ncbi:MAG: hypothetical protein M1838_003799 [Thelocarpon superellum]|nr:MAG: hypothetical protein M1838_003799 [Thelocarpon superellum]
MSRASPDPAAVTTDMVPAQVRNGSKKRKRDKTVPELEVDVTAPEPPSKKALRKAKKSKAVHGDVSSKTKDKDRTTSFKLGPSTPTASAIQAVDAPVLAEVDQENVTDQETKVEAPVTRSGYGIWIGNLAFSVTKADLKRLLVEHSSISDEHITRVHLPPPAATTATRQRSKPQNKGFAYIDLATATAHAEALSLSETLLTGRRVLIKDSKSFVGRPDKPTGQGAMAISAASMAKSPSRRIFIGNLGFDVTAEDLRAHLGTCGPVADVHVATFEDTGKCKGFAWVTFDEVEVAAAAVRGWVKITEPLDEARPAEDEETEGAPATADQPKTSKLKTRRWWVNRLKGRPLRMEFAEDNAVRYKKRFGKDAAAKKKHEGTVTGSDEHDPNPRVEGVGQKTHAVPARPDSSRAPEKVRMRAGKPAKAIPDSVSRLTGGIVESQGKKISF